MTDIVTKLKSISMLDTIVLTMTDIDRIITNPELFNPPLRTNYSTGEYYVEFGSRKHIYNPSSEQVYYPRFTITSTWINQKPAPCLKVELSLPKLLYQNNVDELALDELSLVISTLKDRLNEVGIMASLEDVKNAPIRTIHFSKNILLKDNSATSVIGAINKMPVTRRLEFNTRDYKNDGTALYVDNNSYQLCLYDKIADAFRSNRHTLDKDRTKHQQELLKTIKNTRLPIEILRFEVRILKRYYLNALLQKLGYPINPTLQQVLNPEMAMQILRCHWNLLVPPKSQFLLKFPSPNILNQVIDHLKRSGKKPDSDKTYAIAQFIHQIREYGYRNLEATHTSLFTRRTWYRKTKEYTNIINAITEKSQRFIWVEDIEKALSEYKPMKIKELEQMYRNGFATPQIVN